MILFFEHLGTVQHITAHAAAHHGQCNLSYRHPSNVATIALRSTFSAAVLQKRCQSTKTNFGLPLDDLLLTRSTFSESSFSEIYFWRDVNTLFGTIYFYRDLLLANLLPSSRVYGRKVKIKVK